MTDAGLASGTAPTIRYREWQGAIDAATDVDQLVKLIRAYMAAWTPDQLNLLPWDLSKARIERIEAIVAHAVILSRVELKFQGNKVEHDLLTQMTLTFSAEANRLRRLQSTSKYL
jgi:hypothetical protein